MNNIVSAKFGGSSMGTAKSITQCVEIIKSLLDENKKVVVIVSAVYKVTDHLVEIVNLSKNRKPKLIKSIVNTLEKKHFEILKELGDNKEISEQFKLIFKTLKKLLDGVSVIGDVTPKTEAKILSFGEKLSSLLILACFENYNIKAERIESEKIIGTDSNYLQANVDFARTSYFCNKILVPLLKDKVPIVTGFIGKDTFGDTTLLGRGGSDYTASIIGVCLNAEKINIYTDVNGIMSCDPNIVKNAVSWEELNIDIASEMSFSGAKVIHPKSIFCAIEKKIPVYILNTFNRSFKGTKINFDSDNKGVKGLIGVKDYVLITLKAPNMLESFGFISKVSKIISDHGVGIDVCASSEISFTFSIKSNQCSKKLITDLSKNSKLTIKENVAKICIIGNGILNDQKKIVDIFSILSKKNIYTISSAGTENNITVIIDETELYNSLTLLHSNLIK